MQLKSSQISFSEEAISPEIYDLLQQRKKNSEQSIIIINRRGYVNFAICTQCASPLRCPNCAVTTTLHEKAQVELCHYCGYREIKENLVPRVIRITLYIRELVLSKLKISFKENYQN